MAAKTKTKKQFTDTSALSAFAKTKDDVRSKIYIKKELKEFIDPLSEDEFERLENSILDEGVRDSIILWKTEEGYAIIDGHNRYAICQKHNIKDFPYTLKEFDNIEDVKLYMIGIQLGRRNITSTYRTYLIGLQKNLNKKEGANQYNTDVNITKQIAKQNNIGESTVHRAEKVYEDVNLISSFVGEENKDEEIDYKNSLLKEKKTTFTDIKNIANNVKVLEENNELEKIQQAKQVLKSATTSKQALTQLEEITKDLKPKPVEVEDTRTKKMKVEDFETQLYFKIDTLKEFAGRGYKRNDKRVVKVKQELDELVNNVWSLFD